MAKCFSDLFSSANIEIISSTNIKINQTIEEGVVVVGVVKVITKYGAFVNLGSVDGLIHKKDISWGNIKNSARIKVRSARTIIKYSRSIDALRLIANATMASDETIANARDLLTKLGK